MAKTPAKYLPILPPVPENGVWTGEEQRVYLETAASILSGLAASPVVTHLTLDVLNMLEDQALDSAARLMNKVKDRCKAVERSH